jgi:hypothetical protein
MSAGKRDRRSASVGVTTTVSRLRGAGGGGIQAKNGARQLPDLTVFRPLSFLPGVGEDHPRLVQQLS